MDKLTDILTTFFVNSKPENKPKVISESSSESTSTSKSDYTSESTSTSENASTSESDSTSENNTTEEPKPEEPKPEEPKSEEQKPEEPKPEEETQFDLYSDLSSLDENTEKQIKESNQEQEVQEQEVQEQEIQEQEDLEQQAPEQEDDIVGLKKYILKPSQFYKKNISIVTDEIEGGIEILSDLLYKLSLIRDVEKIYDNTIHIVSDIDNKKLYKQMLLDNPYLYFTNFDVKHSLTKRNITESISDKRSIYIFDNIMVNKYKDLVNSIIDKNVHVFVLSNYEDKTGFDTYSYLGSEKILLYKPNKLKMIHKKFYRYYVKPLSIFEDFDSYYLTVNDENLDLKYIIMKNDELRYN